MNPLHYAMLRECKPQLSCEYAQTLWAKHKLTQHVNSMGASHVRSRSPGARSEGNNVTASLIEIKNAKEHRNMENPGDLMHTNDV